MELYEKKWFRIVEWNINWVNRKFKFWDKRVAELYRIFKPKWAATNTVLKSLADKIYSYYIRLTKSEDGMCKCISSWEIIPREKIQNWHFVSRSILRYRYDDDNCRPQSYRDNVILEGNYKSYTLRMIEIYWHDFVEQRINDKTTFKIRPYEYEEMIVDWVDVIGKYEEFHTYLKRILSWVKYKKFLEILIMK